MSPRRIICKRKAPFRAPSLTKCCLNKFQALKTGYSRNRNKLYISFRLLCTGVPGIKKYSQDEPVKHHFRGDNKRPQACDDRTFWFFMQLMLESFESVILCFVEDNPEPFYFEHDSYILLEPFVPFFEFHLSHFLSIRWLWSCVTRFSLEVFSGHTISLHQSGICSDNHVIMQEFPAGFQLIAAVVDMDSKHFFFCPILNLSFPLMDQRQRCYDKSGLR